MLMAALWSRSSSHPHEQLCQRICSFLGNFSPQLEQSCEVLWALTGTTNKPAFSALFVSIDSSVTILAYKDVFWNGSYFVASCGGVTVSTLRKYIENQPNPED